MQNVFSKNVPLYASRYHEFLVGIVFGKKHWKMQRVSKFFWTVGTALSSQNTGEGNLNVANSFGILKTLGQRKFNNPSIFCQSSCSIFRAYMWRRCLTKSGAIFDYSFNHKTLKGTITMSWLAFFRVCRLITSVKQHSSENHNLGISGGITNFSKILFLCQKGNHETFPCLPFQKIQIYAEWVSRTILILVVLDLTINS